MNLTGLLGPQQRIEMRVLTISREFGIGINEAVDHQRSALRALPKSLYSPSVGDDIDF